MGGEPRELTAGEAWAREQLELLRASGFAPVLIGRFLGASKRRASANRAGRPDLARRAHAWLAVGALAWLVPAAAGVQPFRRRLGHGLLWWGSISLMLDWHLGMFETEAGRPRQLGGADVLTLARAWLVPVAADSPSALVCGLAAATDVLDGRLARRREPTRFGRDLEGLIDACFVLAALHGLTRAGRLGRTAALAEAGRQAAGVGYAVHAYFGRARAPETQLVHAARSLTAARFAGLLAAAAGRPRLGGGLVVSGSAGSVVLTALAARR